MIFTFDVFIFDSIFPMFLTCHNYRFTLRFQSKVRKNSNEIFHHISVSQIHLCTQRKMFFVLSRAWDKENNYLSSLLFYLQKHDAVDILAVCRTRVMYELRNGPRPPKSLCGSVVEYRSAETEDLRFHSSWELRTFSLSHARDRTKNIFLYFLTELKIYYLSHYVNNLFPS